MTSRVFVFAASMLILTVCAGSDPPRISVAPETSAHAFGVQEGLAHFGALRIASAPSEATHVLRLDSSHIEDKLKIIARLSEAGSEEELWSSTFEGSFAEVLGIEYRVANDAADQLGITVTADERRHLGPVEPSDQAVLTEYQQALELLQKEEFETAIAHLRTAVQTDTSFVRGYARLAEAHIALSDRDVLGPHDGYVKGRAFALQALNLDGKFGPAHAAMGNFASTYLWRWEEAEVHFQRALAESPSLPAARHGYAALLIKLRRFDEALDYASPAQRAYFYGAGESPFAGLDPAKHHYLRAADQIRSGNREETLRLLSEAIAARDPLLGYLAADPVFEPLHGETQLGYILDYLGLPIPE